MQRRDLCKYLATAAAVKAFPSWPQTTAVSQLPQGFNRYTQSYAEFCALPPEKRVFYKVMNAQIVETKLDESAWHPPVWNYDPSPMQVAGGMWDDVPLESPFPNLAATSPGKIARVELLGTEARLVWNQQAAALRVQLPASYRPKVDYAAAVKVTVA